MSILTPNFSQKSSDAEIAPKERIEPSIGEYASQVESENAEVFDFGSARKQKFEHEKDELNRELRDLVRAGTRTSINLKRVERTVLGLVSAFTTEDLLTQYSKHVAGNMAVDFVSLCLESEAGRLTKFKAPGVYWLTPGSLDAAMHGERMIMSSNGDDYARVFGQEAFKINSCALIRLELPQIKTRGVLAFGAKAEGYFSDEHGTELIEFLGLVSEQLLTRTFMMGFADAQ